MSKAFKAIHSLLFNNDYTHETGERRGRFLRVTQELTGKLGPSGSLAPWPTRHGPHTVRILLARCLEPLKAPETQKLCARMGVSVHECVLCACTGACIMQVCIRWV